MTIPTQPPTTSQVDYIQTASALLHVLEDRAIHQIIQSETVLTDDQIASVTRRFEEGIARFKGEVHQHRMPNAIEISRIAIVADMLSHIYPDGIRHVTADEIAFNVQDIREARKALSGDVSGLAATRETWEHTVRATFQTGASTQPRPPALEQSLAAAHQVGKLISRSIGIDAIFANVFDAGVEVQLPVAPLPTYEANDPRAADPELMTRLQLILSVTEDILESMTPDTPGEDHASHMTEWFKEKAGKAVEKAKNLVVPSAISKLNAQLKDKEKVLRDSRDQLRTAIYGTEPQVATAAADHAVERSPGTILFLSICPNIPFVIPTLEVRLAFTRPFYYLTKAMHDAMGKIPLIGFFFLLLQGLGQALDAIPRAQVRFVQGVVTESWLANPKQRQRLIRKYLKYVENRAEKPQVDALQRILLSLVS